MIERLTALMYSGVIVAGMFAVLLAKEVDRAIISACDKALR